MLNCALTFGLFVVFGALAFPKLISQKSMLAQIVGLFETQRASASLLERLLVIHGGIYKVLSWSSTGYDEKKIAAETALHVKDSGQLVSDVEKLRDKTDNVDAKKAYEDLVVALRRYQKWVTDVVDIASADVAAANMQMGSAENAFEETISKLRAITASQEAIAQKDYQTALSTISQTIAFIGGAFVIVLLVSLFASFSVSRSITRILSGVADKLSASAHALVTSSQDLAASGEQLASSSTEQSSATQESVAAVTEMSTMIAKTHDFATSSLQLVQRISDQTATGNEVMSDLARSMNSIREAAAKIQDMVTVIADISKKTDVIDDIVFKTQLLSFNASIEAARAGQYGSGFAVVAEEIGNLANTSGNAAKEISQLLEQSKKQVSEVVQNTLTTVEGGQGIAEKALAIFHEISETIGAISEKVRRITEASQEQNKGVMQVTEAMKQLNQSAHTVNDIASRSSQSSDTMRDLSSTVAEMTSSLDQLVRSHES